MADDAILDALLRLEERINGQMHALHGEMLRRFDALTGHMLDRFDAVDRRFDVVDERFRLEHDWASGHFDAIYHRFDRLETEYQSLSAGVKRLEEAQQPPM